ncbi:MAG: sigma-70 family RNA polymerase sigma factor [Planctomycetota bacterium]
MRSVPFSNPEVLLAHQDFVRALARRLISDEDLSEDISQETLLAALQHPPGRDRPLRSWLAAVALNFVRKRWRDEQRRRVREYSASRSDAVPSASDVLQRETLRRRVVQAVLALPETYRSPILLRFYEDVPPREIARRLGLPVETVKSQLKRGLRELRQQLDQEFGGDREACRLALVSIAGVTPAVSSTATATAVGSIALSALMMKTLGVAILGVAIVLAGALFLFMELRAPSQPDADPTAPGATAQAPALPSEPVAASRSELSPVSRGLEPHGTLATVPESYRQSLARVTGRVMSHDWCPVPQASIALLEYRFASFVGTDYASLFEDKKGAAPPGLEISRTYSDADGRFVLEGAISDAVHAVVVHHAESGGALHAIDAALHSGEMTDIGDIVLLRSVALTGRVLDEQGRAIPGARVRVAWSGAIPGRAVLDEVLKEWRDSSKVIFRDSGEETVLDQPPFPLAFVSLPACHAGGDGTFRLAGLPTRAATIIADAPGFATTCVGPFTPSERGAIETGDIVLTRGRLLGGRVLGAGAKPLRGIEVVVGCAPPGSNAIVARPAMPTGEDGSFQLGGFPNTGQPVYAARRQIGEAWTIVRSPESSTEAEIVLPPLHALTLRFEDEANHPVSGVRLLMRPATRWPPASAPYRSVPGVGPGPHDALVEVPSIAPGEHQLLARAPGYPIVLQTVAIAAETVELTVRFAAGRDFPVRVSDGATGTPVEHAQVSLISHPAEPPLDQQWTDADGRAVLGPVPLAPPLPFHLLVRRPGYVAWSGELEVEGSETMEVALARGGTLIGQITQAGLPPQARFTVSVKPKLSRLPIDIERTARRFATTDARGAFRISGLMEGTYEYELHASFLHDDPFWMLADLSQGAVQTGRFETRDSETQELTIDLGSPAARTATIRGMVHLQGAPARGFRIKLMGDDGERAETVTEASGCFELTGLSAGAYRVVAEMSRETSERITSARGAVHRSIELDLGAVELMEIELDLLDLPVRVVDASGSPLPEAHVVVKGRAGADRCGLTASTDAKGDARFTVPFPALYEIGVSHPHAGETRAQVQVPPGGLAGPILIAMDAQTPCAGHLVIDLGPGKTSPAFVFLELSGDPAEPLTRDFRSKSIVVLWEFGRFPFRATGMQPGRYVARLCPEEIGNANVPAVTFDLPPAGDEELILRFTAH